MDQQQRNERFEQCYDKYYAMLMQMAEKSLKRRELAEEVCQQIFVAFYVNMDCVNPGLEKFWLLRCTKNLIIDQKRKTLRHKEILVDIFASEENLGLIDERQADLEDHMDAALLLRRIFSEISRVNIHWFDALCLSYFEGCSCDEAARRLGITENAMRARLYRARGYIRQHYGVDYFG